MRWSKPIFLTPNLEIENNNQEIDILKNKRVSSFHFQTDPILILIPIQIEIRTKRQDQKTDTIRKSGQSQHISIAGVKIRQTEATD